MLSNLQSRTLCRSHDMDQSPFLPSNRTRLLHNHDLSESVLLIRIRSLNRHFLRRESVKVRFETFNNCNNVSVARLVTHISRGLRNIAGRCLTVGILVFAYHVQRVVASVPRVNHSRWDIASHVSRRIHVTVSR